MNWMIIVGGLFIVSGLTAVFSDTFAAICTIAVGAALLHFGFRKKKRNAKQPRCHNAHAKTPTESIAIIQTASIDPRKRFIAFDLETTGLSPSNDRIIEISAVLFEDCVPCDSFSSLINPGMSIPSAASKINHIYDADVSSAPGEAEVLKRFCDFVGADALRGDVSLVAHNAQFDVRFLSQALKRCKISSNFSFCDTLKLCKEAHLDLPNNKLGTVAKHFDISQQDAHRAEDDARVCGEVFVHLLNLHK